MFSQPLVRACMIAVALSLASGCAEVPSEGGGSAGTVSGAVTVIDNVTVIDAVHGLRERQRVLVRGDAIVAVEPADGEAPAGRVVDGRDKFLVPGLWDMHVHFLYEEGLTEAMPELFLRYGITSVRDTGGNLERLTALRSRLEASGALAPRIFIAGPLLDGRFVVYDGGDPGRPPLGTAVPDTEAARQAVRRLRSAGADLIKIYELVSPEVFDALVAAARQEGLPIAAHVPLTMVADEAGPRVDSMEHLRNIELACADDWRALLERRRRAIDTFGDGRGYDLRASLHEQQRLRAIADYDRTRCDQVLAALRETIQVPTLRLNAFELVKPYQAPDWEAALAQLPAPVRREWSAEVAERRDAPEEDHAFAEWSLFLVSRLQEAGVPVGAGTDTPITLAIPGYSLHTELELLVRAGLTPLQALSAATLQPARFFGLEQRMGSIEAGKVADLLLLERNPLEDIAHTRAIARVMARGEWVPAHHAR